VELLCDNPLADPPAGICSNANPPGAGPSACDAGDGCDSLRVEDEGLFPVSGALGDEPLIVRLRDDRGPRRGCRGGRLGLSQGTLGKEQRGEGGAGEQTIDGFGNSEEHNARDHCSGSPGRGCKPLDWVLWIGLHWDSSCKLFATETGLILG